LSVVVVVVVVITFMSSKVSFDVNGMYAVFRRVLHYFIYRYSALIVSGAVMA